MAFTAPAPGTVAAIHRGERRALISVVIDVDPGDAVAQQVKFSAFSGRSAAELDVGAVRALMQESALWTALRQRPFGHVPATDGTAEAIFVTATDSRPHAPPPALVIGPRADDFRAGLVCLTKVGAGLVYLCIDAGEKIDAAAGVQVERFDGPHPSGTVGWHIRAELCGKAIGLDLRRHRRFESCVLLLFPPCPGHEPLISGPATMAVKYGRHGIVGYKSRHSYQITPGIGHNPGWRKAAEAMGIDWLNQNELTQAIPPAYTEFIGKQI